MIASASERKRALQLLMQRRIPFHHADRARIAAAGERLLDAQRTLLRAFRDRGAYSASLSSIYARIHSLKAAYAQVIADVRKARAREAIELARVELASEHERLSDLAARRLIDELDSAHSLRQNQVTEVITITQGQATSRTPGEYAADLIARAASHMADRPCAP